MANPYSVFRVERDGHVGTIWLDRPEKRNAMGKAFWDELPRCVAELDDDPEIRAIVVAAEGPDLSVGLDLTELGQGALAAGNGEMSDAAAKKATLDLVQRWQAAVSSLAETTKPTIGAMYGWCIGGAIDLTAACDIRVAAADAKLSIRETRIAIVADIGTLQRITRIVGKGHARELAFTGRDFSADYAKEIGYVNHVYADRNATIAAAQALAHEIAANSPLAVQGTKRVMNYSEEHTIAEGLEYVALWNSAYLHSDDLKEAMRAFMERRDPAFTGQ